MRQGMLDLCPIVSNTDAEFLLYTAANPEQYSYSRGSLNYAAYTSDVHLDILYQAFSIGRRSYLTDWGAHQ